MPLQLTTEKTVGDLDTNTYTHAKITLYRHDLQTNQIHITVEEGWIDTGEFIPGKFSDPKVYLIEGAEFAAIAPSLPTSGTELLYDGVARVLYQHLIDNEGYAGTIV